MDKFCVACGNQMHQQAEICVKCGVRASGVEGEKKGLTALILCLFLGYFGAHRFYVGKTFTGLLMLCTFSLLGIWYVIDLIMLITGNFSTKGGQKLKL